MNLQQIENKIKELQENSKKTSQKLSAIVNCQNFKIIMSNRDQMIDISNLFDAELMNILEDLMNILEDRARAEYQAAERAIEEFEKKFA